MIYRALILGSAIAGLIAYDAWRYRRQLARLARMYETPAEEPAS